MSTDQEVSNRSTWVNTNEFETFLDSCIWRNISSERKNLYGHVISHAFEMYLTDEKRRKKVVRWILKEKPFTTPYIFIPICIRNHWNLLILCNLGSDRGCMFILDSLMSLGQVGQQESWIRRILFDMYTTAKREEEKDFIDNIPLYVPSFPQQQDGNDCGMFVLFYISVLVNHNIDAFLLDQLHKKQKDMDWFKFDEYEHFRAHVNSCRRNMVLQGSLYTVRPLLRSQRSRGCRYITKEQLRDRVNDIEIALDREKEVGENEEEAEKLSGENENRGEKSIEGKEKGGEQDRQLALSRKGKSIVHVEVKPLVTRSQGQKNNTSSSRRPSTPTKEDQTPKKRRGQHGCYYLPHVQSRDVTVKEKISVHFNDDGQPDDANTTSTLAHYLGVLARSENDCPLDVPTWHKMPIDTKKRLWTKVQKLFMLPEAAEYYVMRSIAKK